MLLIEVGRHAVLCITAFKFDILLEKKKAAQTTVTFFLFSEVMHPLANNLLSIYNYTHSQLTERVELFSLPS